MCILWTALVFSSISVVSSGFSYAGPSVHPGCLPPASKYYTEAGKASIKFPAGFTVEEVEHDAAHTTKVMAELNGNVFCSHSHGMKMISPTTICWRKHLSIHLRRRSAEK